MPTIESLGAAEQQTMAQLRPALTAHGAVSEQVFNAVSEILGAAPELPISQVALSRRVVTVLLVRLSNDLRVAALLALRGYPLQAATLVASMYEVAHCVAYIGSDDSRADAWIRHDDPTKSFRSVKMLIEDTVNGFGINDPVAMCAREYRVYRQLCLAKHSNPVLQKDHGHYMEEHAIITINGPDSSMSGIRVARFALQHAIRLTVLALASFLENHVPQGARENLRDRLDRIDEATREHTLDGAQRGERAAGDAPAFGQRDYRRRGLAGRAGRAGGRRAGVARRVVADFFLDRRRLGVGGFA
jgi:hypothetical protein